MMSVKPESILFRFHLFFFFFLCLLRVKGFFWNDWRNFERLLLTLILNRISEIDFSKIGRGLKKLNMI